MRPWKHPIPLLLTVLLLAPALAGCITPREDLTASTTPTSDELSRAEVQARLTKPVVDEVLYNETSFEASDGTRLALNLFRPAPGEVPTQVSEAGKVPVLLVMTPYRTVEDVLDRPYNQRLKDYFTPRGYAVAFLDVRGTNDSGGCLGQTGMRQAQDGYEAVEWLANRSWSNGKVGMFGASYDAETQQSTATLAPPHLETIVPVASITSQYLWFYKGGVPYDLQETGMTLYAGIGLAPPTDPGAADDYPERVPCHVENHRASSDPDGEFTAYWQERNWKPRVHNITASVLYVHGLQDWNVKPDAIPGWYNEIPSPKRAILGQWGHAYPDHADWTLTLHRWFDHHLLGIDTGVMKEPAVMVEDNLERWRAEEAFPPTPDRNLTLYLRGDAMGEEGKLSPEPPRSSEAPDAYRDVPGDQRTAVHPPNLDYVSDPLLRDVHVSGVPNVTLWFDSSETETHLVFHLLDIGPDGSAEVVVRGYRNALYHHGDLTDPTPLTPGKMYSTRLSTFPVDHVFQEGHRVGLLVMSDDAWAERDQTTARNRIHHDPGHASAVTLPVVQPNASSFLSPPHPTEVDGGDEGDDAALERVDLGAWGVTVGPPQGS